jgi:hypothetical protein
MEQDTEVTKVIFRQFEQDDHAIIALFPELPGSSDPQTCLSYIHVGQHGAASVQAARERTRPAYPGNYAPLKAELESLGYKLQVIHRFTQAAQEKRRAALKAMDRASETQEAPNG